MAARRLATAGAEQLSTVQPAGVLNKLARVPFGLLLQEM